MNNKINENLRNECAASLTALKKVKNPDTAELQSKIEWCLGSYDNDHNPAGLHEVGTVTLQTLKAIKTKQPRKVTKKVIDGLEKSINAYETV